MSQTQLSASYVLQVICTAWSWLGLHGFGLPTLYAAGQLVDSTMRLGGSQRLWSAYRQQLRKMKLQSH